jgi:hypothetical protein
MRGGPDPREAGAVREAGISEREKTSRVAVWGSFVPAFGERLGTNECCLQDVVIVRLYIRTASSHATALMFTF